MENESKIDRIGIALSGLCLAHCFLVPIAALFLPWLSSYLEHDFAHFALLILIIPTAIFSFYHGARKHNDYFPLKVGSLGISLLVIGIMKEAYFHSEEEVNSLLDIFVDHIPTILGSILLVFAHLRNLRNCRCGHNH